MNDVFHEVDEEIRRDKALVFFNRHGTKLILAAVLVVAGAAAWRFYQEQSFQERAALGARFEIALNELEAGKRDALTALAGEKGGGTYPALAKFRLASEFAHAARDEAGARDAASAFDALSSTTGLPTEWRELARLRAALTLIDYAGFDEIEQRLAPLAAGMATFRHSAREGIALAAFRNGQREKALDALQAIILDAESPGGLRQRAEVLLALIRTDAKS